MTLRTDLAVEKAAAEIGHAIRMRIERDIDPNRAWAGAGEYLKAVVVAAVSNGGNVDVRLKAPLGQNDESGATGGYLVPQRVNDELLSRRFSAPDSVLGLCRRFLTREPMLTVVGLDDANKSVEGQKYGGAIAYWRKPGYTVNLSSLKLRSVNFELQNLTVIIAATNEMLSDVQNLGDHLADAARYAIEDTLLENVLFGDGIAKPLGAFVGPSLVTIAAEMGQGKHVTKTNINKMWATLPLPLRESAAWFINADVEAELDETAGVRYLPTGSVAGQPFATLKGRPVIVTDHCPAIGTTGDIALGGMAEYGLAFKVGGIATAISAHVEFLTEQSILRYTLRVDGKGLWNVSATPAKGATTQSPFVVLATRA